MPKRVPLIHEEPVDSVKPKRAFFYKSRLKILASLLFALLFFAGAFWFLILKDLPSPAKLASSDVAQTTKIYDRNDTLLYEIYADQNRTFVKLSDLPPFIKQGTVSIEDKDFYKHGGINLIGGILRGLRDTIVRKELQGGSTITQQLVKKTLLSDERTLQRKIKEIILSFWTEQLYSKDHILEMYLNNVPYGGTAWGIEAAAQTYFGKSAKDLSLPESALLVGLPAAPTRYSPFGAHPEYAKDRQRAVLTRMEEDKYITKAQKEEALATPLTYKKITTNIKAPHFVMYVKQKLAEQFGEKVVEKGGLHVKTTLDFPLQEFAENTVASEVAKLKNLHVGNGAALVIRPPTGEMLAMVGSTDYFSTESGNFNVTTALRQPGSSIKPINYAIGLELKKVTPATVFLDTPTCFSVAFQKPYCPVNYDGKFHGATQLRFALGNSFNIPAVKMLALNSVNTFVASSSAFGIDSISDPSKYGLSLTLGGGEVPMTEMATAFGVFANTGLRKDLTSILLVTDSKGNKLYEFSDPNFVQNVTDSLLAPSSLLINGPRAVSSETSFLISHILLDNNARSLEFGAGSALVIPNKGVSVKTGTTDDKRDNWTIGYTPNFLTAVWVGNNDNSPMNPYLTSGITGAAPIWNKIMTHVLKSQPDLWPKQPANIIGANICSLSGNAPPNADPNASDKGCPTRYEYFIKGTLPYEREVLKTSVPVDKTTDKLAPSSQKDNIEVKEKQIVKDMFGMYCIDCNHDGGDPYTTIKL
ncbi:hypothetical protein A3D77_01225 [Candidatus Gottesmanbacteria bacterium RIFCSPHIGHO2_02_FULL_39_11]|uniref:Uncharacterized protein n=1 Tax=Candidatus Gottesmanbacteria bacterium RIFCSPHIGHO2_02_FULL_39_11 TaxID=1798382 RepID=A0A1F5ZT81_9BACT|nr:MAG: hypothetical protein A3D77_01225 [Candidatus Gottesmanbacteria bacterium RIFCSPHIGHO2_02_FULL_39_11]